jgi:hypothetical protein
VAKTKLDQSTGMFWVSQVSKQHSCRSTATSNCPVTFCHSDFRYFATEACFRYHSRVRRIPSSKEYFGA